VVVAKISTLFSLGLWKILPVFPERMVFFSPLLFHLFRLDCVHLAVVQYRTRTARLVPVQVLCATPCDVTLLFDLLGSG